MEARSYLFRERQVELRVQKHVEDFVDVDGGTWWLLALAAGWRLLLSYRLPLQDRGEVRYLVLASIFYEVLDLLVLGIGQILQPCFKILDAFEVVLKLLRAALQLPLQQIGKGLCVGALLALLSLGQLQTLLRKSNTLLDAASLMHLLELERTGLDLFFEFFRFSLSLDET